MHSFMTNEGHKVDFDKKLMFTYKNYKGEVSLRHVFPVSVRFGNTQWHTKDQWLLEAWDFAKCEYREFAMNDIIEIG